MNVCVRDRLSEGEIKLIKNTPFIMGAKMLLKLVDWVAAALILSTCLAGFGEKKCRDRYFKIIIIRLTG